MGEEACRRGTRLKARARRWRRNERYPRVARILQPDGANIRLRSCRPLSASSRRREPIRRAGREPNDAEPTPRPGEACGPNSRRATPIGRLPTPTIRGPRGNPLPDPARVRSLPPGAAAALRQAQLPLPDPAPAQPPLPAEAPRSTPAAAVAALCSNRPQSDMRRLLLQPPVFSCPCFVLRRCSKCPLRSTYAVSRPAYLSACICWRILQGFPVTPSHGRERTLYTTCGKVRHRRQVSKRQIMTMNRTFVNQSSRNVPMFPDFWRLLSRRLKSPDGCFVRERPRN